MARKNQVVEMNTFVGGLVTEASPLTFPDNASIDEDNFELLKNGSRRRRLGMDLESNYQEVTTSVSHSTSDNVAFTTFKWNNAGGIPDNDIVVVQVGNELKFFTLGSYPISANLIHTHTSSESTKFTNFSYASVDGMMVVANKTKNVTVFDYSGGSVTDVSVILYVRDLFGLEDIDVTTGKDLSIASNITIRPLYGTDPHIYNLRNQGWGQARRVYQSENTVDPIREFKLKVSSESNLYQGVLKPYTPDPEIEAEAYYISVTSSPFTKYEFDYGSHPSGVTTVLIQNNSLGNLDYDGDGYAEELFVGKYLVWNQSINSWEQLNDSPAESDGKYPSNADTVISELYPDANDSDNRTVDRFHAQNLISSPIGSTPAPKGFFIIDAMERGTSRYDEYSLLLDNDNNLRYPIESIPLDKTPGGPGVVAAYGGRIFYSGFSGEIVGGDSRSPRMTSYVLFSRLVGSRGDINLCYQDGDPTSKEEPDLVDTDGGFIRIDGAYNIIKMIPVGMSLAVIASNGVWMISGGSDYGFTATNYAVNKITEHGCNNPESVVLVDGAILFWSDDGIYSISKDQYGDFVPTNLTTKSIQTFYGNIDPIAKTICNGSYDNYDGKVRWLYNNYLNTSSETKELVFDVNLGSFYTSTIKDLDSDSPRVICGLEVPPYSLSEYEDQITYSGSAVTHNSENIYYTRNIKVSGSRELMYLCVTNSAGNIKFSFSKYYEPTFYDWKSVDGTGVDAFAYVVTGYSSGGDFQLDKQVPYVTFHFERTESGFYTDGNGDLWPLNPSSCMVQAQWNWSNSSSSGKWGTPFQAYRYNRYYMPSGISDEFDTGFSVLNTKNKLRGRGKVLSLYIYTAPGKDCRLLGWSMLFSVDTNV